jgi:acyl-coenzyme A thioesterase PaaI-like protein
MVDFNEQELLEGLNGYLGFRIDAWREGYAEISVEIDDRHRNRQGGVHGGTMTALKGTTLTCAARVIRAGRRIYFSSAEVKDDQDNLVATAEAVYAYVDR